MVHFISGNRTINHSYQILPKTTSNFAEIVTKVRKTQIL